MRLAFLLSLILTTSCLAQRVRRPWNPKTALTACVERNGWEFCCAMSPSALDQEEPDCAEEFLYYRSRIEAAYVNTTEHAPRSPQVVPVGRGDSGFSNAYRLALRRYRRNEKTQRSVLRRRPRWYLDWFNCLPKLVRGRAFEARPSHAS